MPACLASTGWLSCFKTRHCIVGKVLPGTSTVVNGEAASEWMSDNAASTLKQYGLSDTYNADENGLFCKMLPSMALDLKGQRLHGGKHSKKRLSLRCCRAPGKVEISTRPC